MYIRKWARVCLLMYIQCQYDGQYLHHTKHCSGAVLPQTHLTLHSPTLPKLNTMCVHTWELMPNSMCYNKLVVLVPGSRMVVSNTEIDIVQYQILPHGNVVWKYFYIPSTSVTSEHLVFLSWKLICKRRTCLKPDNVNMLLSLNKDLLMSRLASY